MKILTIILAATVFLGCAPQKATESPVKHSDTTVLSTTSPTMDNASIPACISKMIADFTAAPVGNPPRKIWSYTYRDRTVYYVQPECCDNFSDLYDSTCTLLGHPDGGFSGRGDGAFPDFIKEKTNEKLIWQDKRK